MITGGNSGTGYHTAKSYYEHGARVLILCRDASRAAQAMEDIKKGGEVNIYSKMVYTPAEATGTLDFVQCDLADLNSVESAAKTILEKENRLDLLFANAGIMATPEGQYTKQGYSLQFGTNVGSPKTWLTAGPWPPAPDLPPPPSDAKDEPSQPTVAISPHRPFFRCTQ